MCIGKTDRSIWSEAMAKYQYRLKHYIKFSVIYLPNIKISKNEISKFQEFTFFNFYNF